MSGRMRASVWFAALLAGADIAHAWNDTGHMAAALGAYEALATEARAELGHVLRHHPRFATDFASRMPAGIARGSQAERDRWLFAFASTWPDTVRRFEHVDSAAERMALIERYNRPSWHFVNQPLFASAIDEKRLSSVVPDPALVREAERPEHEWNVVQALLHESDVLASDAPDGQRAIALCWILHLAADLHQPLHTVALFSSGAFPEGDRGGNRIAPASGTNLHSMWDGALGNDRRWKSVRRLLARLPDEPVAEGTPAQWAAEGRALAERIVYVPAVLHAVSARTRPSTANVRVDLPVEYALRMRGTAERQIVRAARRTAGLLERAVSARPSARIQPATSDR